MVGALAATREGNHGLNNDDGYMRTVGEQIGERDSINRPFQERGIALNIQIEMAVDALE